MASGINQMCSGATSFLGRLAAKRNRTSRRLIGGAFLMAGWFTAATVNAQPPMVTFPTPANTPGLQLPFNLMNGVDPFAGDATVDYGKQAVGNYGWVFDTFQGTSIESSGSLGRYSPTLMFDSFAPPPTVPHTSPCDPGTNLCPAAMLENQDWVFHVEFRHRGAYDPADADFILTAKAEPGFSGVSPGSTREDRIFALARGVDANDWSILAGNSTGGWSTVVTDLQHPMDSEGTPPEQYVDFDVHFRAAEQVMDFYWESQLVGTAATGHGRYDVDLIQFEHKQEWDGVQDFRNFRLGHIGESTGPIEGDYNGNGVVDAADYAIWRDSKGAAGLPGDLAGDGDDGTGTGTPDGMVDESDYAFWSARFGATTPLGSGSGSTAGVAAVVPEPAGFVLLAFAAPILLFANRFHV